MEMSAWFVQKMDREYPAVMITCVRSLSGLEARASGVHSTFDLLHTKTQGEFLLHPRLMAS